MIMNHPIRLILLAIGLIAIGTIPAQAQLPTIDDFTLAGGTYRTDDLCLRLTDERDYASGSIWYKRPIDLTKPFSVGLRLVLGCKDSDGADWMVFVMTSQSNRVGYRGEVARLAAVAAGAEDHVAIMANGQVGHFSNLAGPLAIPNLEDCKKHRFVVIWRPDEKLLEVEIDGEPVISVKKDIVKDIFGGNATVYWGMTAATGRYNNIHEVCFDWMANEWLPPALHRDGKMD